MLVVLPLLTPTGGFDRGEVISCRVQTVRRGRIQVADSNHSLGQAALRTSQRFIVDGLQAVDSFL